MSNTNYPNNPQNESPESENNNNETGAPDTKRKLFFFGTILSEILGILYIFLPTNMRAHVSRYRATLQKMKGTTRKIETMRKNINNPNKKNQY
ncbi:MAG: hypothetical protein KBD63_07080 [Bacteriovoracaceae bacterium]|nr:hypothetical protein [Bacteriovoracaceae bacterium]